MPNLRTITGAISLLLISQTTLASDLSEFRIDAGVGVLDVEPSEDNELHIEVELEGNRKGFFSHRKRDVTDLDIKTSVRNGTLYVELNDDDYDDLEVHWRVSLPSLERTYLDLSVGQINAVVGATELEVELGVGEANVTVPEMYVGDVEVDVGVGSAKLKGAENTKSDRAIVSEEVVGNGLGDRKLKVDVGVGEANVRLSPAS